MGMNSENKKMTVVTWDARYREDLETGLECLSKQTVRDQINFIHVEWGKQADPIFSKYDFIDVHCLGLPFRKVRPSFDTGIQYNYGLYESETPWVSYYQFDVIARDFYENVLNKINLVEEQQPSILYLEGWQINSKANMTLAQRYAEFEEIKKDYEENLDQLAYEYTGPAKKPPTVNGAGITVKKSDFIKECGGWMWNVPNRSEWWTGPGHPQARYGGRSLRSFMSSKNLALFKQNDMVQFAIPHPKPPGNFHSHTVPLYKGGVKHYAEFEQEWVSQHYSGVKND